jgi:hypothetical protein
MEGIQGALDLSEADPDPQFATDFEYREKSGVVLYYMICRRPDIRYCVQLLARFSSKVNRIAAAGLTHLLQYCYNTRFQKLILGGQKRWRVDSVTATTAKTDSRDVQWRRSSFSLAGARLTGAQICDSLHRRGRVYLP